MSESKIGEKQASLAEIEVRVNLIKARLVRGDKRSQILEYAKDQWEYGRAWTDEMIARAKVKIIEESKAAGTNTLEWHIAERQRLWWRTCARNPYASVRRVRRARMGNQTSIIVNARIRNHGTMVAKTGVSV